MVGPLDTGRDDYEDIPESFVIRFSLEKSTRLFLLKEVKLSQDRKMIKVLEHFSDILSLFPPLQYFR